MFRFLFHKPLEIEVAGKLLRFDSKSDFEFALASRTEVPATKIAELMRFDVRQLTEEASSVRQVERHFVEILSRSIQEPGSIAYLLREMDIKLFSQDHQWRGIMQVMARQPARFDDYKQLALVKYMQYLAARQDVLKGIYAHKAAGSAPAPPRADGGAEPPFHETVIFDLAEPLARRGHACGGEPGAPHLQRLPRGERVEIRLDPGEVAELLLSRHPFRLRLGEAAALLGEDGTEQPLGPGRNVLGRHPQCDVVIDPACRDVSRTHLIVEVESAATALLTDLSSHGTFVPGRLLERLVAA